MRRPPQQEKADENTGERRVDTLYFTQSTAPRGGTECVYLDVFLYFCSLSSTKYVRLKETHMETNVNN